MTLNLGEQIRTLRLKRKLSQIDLCGSFFDRVTLSKIENNKMLPSISQLQYIADALNVNITTFFITNNINCENFQEYIYQKSYICILFEDRNYYDIVKVVELDKIRFNNLKDFNKNYYLGASYFNLGRFKDARICLKKYINGFIKANDSIQCIYVLNFAMSLNILFKITIKNSNYEKGVHYLSTAKKYLKLYDKDNSLVNCIIHNNLAISYLKLQKYDNIITILNNYLQTYSTIYNIELLGSIHISLTIAYYNCNNYEEAIIHAKKSVYLFLYSDNIFEVGNCYLNYINALRYCNKLDEALDIVLKCEKDYEVINYLYQRFKIQEMIINFNKKNFNKVILLSKDINLKSLLRSDHIEYYFMIGHVSFFNKNYEEAYKFLTKCEKFLNINNFIFDLTLLYHDLYTITKDDIYISKIDSIRKMPVRKNILLSSDFN